MANIAGGTLTFCPFYIREWEKTITCEGFYGGGEVLQRFNTASQRVVHQHKYCFTQNYNECPIARELNKRYGG